MKLLLGDCIEQMKQLADNSVDAVVTDPPYGLSFMNKHWDYDVPSVDIWREVLRVLKPGGHLLSFFGTRTYHRGVVRIEDAGFEIRDQIQWIYGSGFPKSLNIGKAIDKQNGNELEVIGKGRSGSSSRVYQSEDQTTAGEYEQTKSNNEWSGWGTALKPANEPIVLARKPLIGTVAKNVEMFGTGGLNIDESRIETKPRKTGTKPTGEEINAAPTSFSGSAKRSLRAAYDLKDLGRWPANVILDESAAALLDEQSIAHGIHSAGKARVGKILPTASFGIGGSGNVVERENGTRRDDGNKIGASRFFYVAKTSKRERNAGLDGMVNRHPTVKPQKLMQYLIKLVTPPKGTVLDPFMGSGSTGCAAVSLGFDFIGCEMNQEYFEIAQKRIEHHDTCLEGAV